jgi:hypothetical protein
LTWSRQPRGRPAGFPDWPLANRPRRSLIPCFTCFIRSRSGIANSFNRNPAPARRVAMRREYNANMAIACICGEHGLERNANAVPPASNQRHNLCYEMLVRTRWNAAQPLPSSSSTKPS